MKSNICTQRAHYAFQLRTPLSGSEIIAEVPCDKSDSAPMRGRVFSLKHTISAHVHRRLVNFCQALGLCFSYCSGGACRGCLNGDAYLARALRRGQIILDSTRSIDTSLRKFALERRVLEQL